MSGAAQFVKPLHTGTGRNSGANRRRVLAVRFFIYYYGSIEALAGCGSAAAQAFNAESVIIRFVTPLHPDTALLLCELGGRAVNTSNQKILRRQGFKSGSFHTSFPGPQDADLDCHGASSMRHHN